jgi:hypothetical protein
MGRGEGTLWCAGEAHDVRPRRVTACRRSYYGVGGATAGQVCRDAVWRRPLLTGWQQIVYVRVCRCVSCCGGCRITAVAGGGWS